MKKIALFLSILFVISSCNNKPKDYVTLTGQITNPTSDKLIIHNRGFSKSIKVTSDGSFSDTLKIEQGLYSAVFGKQSAKLFLKNGFELHMTLNTDKFDETIKYAGTGAEHSNFLVEKMLFQEKLFDDDLEGLSSEELKRKFDGYDEKLTAFYSNREAIDTSIINYEVSRIKPMLLFLNGQYAKKNRLIEAMAGKPSPTFVDYQSYNGGTTSLETLKGKYTYIDIWATWCAPCIAQFPALKVLEEEYEGKNINFLSIAVDEARSHEGSWDKAKEAWKTMVAEKNLGGIQLFAPEGTKSEFIRAYKIFGIPRFILIDPDGNVISPDARRPSDPKLKELFNELNI